MPSCVRGSLVFSLVAGALLSLAVSANAQTKCNTNDAGTPPCFANVPDILNGQTRLLPNDDLIVNTSGANPSTLNSYPAGGNLQTMSSAISGQAATSITNPNAIALSNQITIRGRLWAVNHDQILSASVNASGGGQGLTAGLEQDDSWVSPPALPAFANSQMLYGTSADFLGNGYDQMVIVGFQPGSPGQLVLQAGGRSALG